MSSGRRSKGRWRALLAAALLVVAVGSAAAAPGTADLPQAQRLCEQGESAFEAGRFEDAARLFEEAYLVSRRPRLLWNAALANRRQYEIDRDPARLRRARALLQNYGELAESPREKEEALTEERAVAAELELLQPRAAPPPSPAAPGPEPVALPAAPAAAPTPAVVAPSAPRLPERPPVYKRWWLWTIVGGVVIAGTATGLGVALTPRAAPSSDLGNFKVSF